MPLQTILLNQGLAKFETFFMNDNSGSLITNHFLHGENRSIHESIESFPCFERKYKRKNEFKDSYFSVFSDNGLCCMYIRRQKKFTQCIYDG